MNIYIADPRDLLWVFYFSNPFLYMELLTQGLLEIFRNTGSQEHIPDPVVIAKFFTPWSSWTWCATEFNEQE